MNKENIDQKNAKENTSSEAEVNTAPENNKEIKNQVETHEEVERGEEVLPDEGVQSEEEVELNRLNDELSESKDKYLRLYSEFENYRRRTAKEKLEMVQTANEELMQALLPVIDDMERAEKSFTDKEADLKAVKEGVKLISNKLKKILEQKGLKVMEGKEGMNFDPEFHEAITQIPAPKKSLKGKVVDVIEKGYVLKEKVIRYAKVVIGN